MRDRATQQPAWGQSREFEITTRSVGRSSITQTTTGDLDEDEEDDEDELIHGRRKRKVAFMPSPGEFFLSAAFHPVCEKAVR